VLANVGGSFDPAYVVVDTKYWYGTGLGSGGWLWDMPKGGGTLDTLESSQSGARGIAINTTSSVATALYWADEPAGTLNYLAMTNGNFTTGNIVTLSGLTDPYEVAVDSTNVYWTQADIPNGGLFKAALPLKASSNPIALVSTPQTQGIALDSTYVYFTTLPSNPDGGTTSVAGTVQRVDISTSAVKVLATGLANPSMIDVDTNNIYWATNVAGSGTVVQMPKGGGTQTVLATGQDGPYPVKSDGTYVYWGNENSGQLWAVPVGGGTPIMLASGQVNVRDIALDSSCVYWTTRGGGTIARMGKPPPP
jgi:hypothetical protein